MERGYWILIWILCTDVLVTAVDSRRHSRRHQALKGNPEEVYTAWSPWGRCSRRCKQRRTKSCLQPLTCSTEVLREERPCFTERCIKEHEVTPPRRRTQKKSDDDEFRILNSQLQPLPFSEWSEWSSCSKSCITRRSRTCIMTPVCGRKTLEESALCYAKDTKCEWLYGPKKKRKKSAERGTPMLHEAGVVCGVSPIASQQIDMRSKLRIIGGREAKQGSWPWQLTILNRHREPFCGATLIARSWVLTAAHCIRKKLIVRAGEHDLMTAEGTEQESDVAEYFIHPHYNADTVDGDIALLKLRNPFHFDNYTQSACLPNQTDFLTVHSLATILGWGKRHSTSLYGTDHLHQAEVPVVALDECRSSYPTYPIKERMLCAGHKQGRVDSCAGDSGGPLLQQRDGRWTVFGVTSFGDGCGRKRKYGIYSSVPKYVKWIRRTMSRNP